MKVFEIAKRMLNTDTSIDYIAEMTGLYKKNNFFKIVLKTI